MAKVAALVLGGLSLSACENPFADKDWRESVEDAEDCTKRMRAEYHEGVLELLDSQEIRVPTYTFDITKAGFEDIKELTVLDEGDEKGSVQVSGLGAPPWRLRNFLRMNVDEKGAFFMGTDPSYYRYQGEPIPLVDVFVEGCKQQRPGMRFLSFTFSEMSFSDDPAVEDILQNETEN
ncbi:MAG: hypothetical protein ABJP48_09390 [Erythrobacter sp.]